MQKNNFFDSIGGLAKAIAIVCAVIIPIGYFVKYVEKIPWWWGALAATIVVMVFLFLLRKYIFPTGAKVGGTALNAAVAVIGSLMNTVTRFTAVVIGFVVVFGAVHFISRANGAYLSFTVTMLIASASIGTALTLVVLIMQGTEKAEGASTFIKGVCGFAWLICFITLFTAGYHYVKPRFFNPYEEELVAEHNIDPATCELFGIDVLRNPDTGDKLRPMTPEDRACVLEKERKDREAVLNAIEPIIIGFSENASANENQSNVYRRQAQKNYSITMVSPSTAYQSVVRSGDPIHIEWRTDAPGYMQIHWTNGGENWMYVDKVVTSIGSYDWHPKIPGGTHIIVRIGVYDSSSGKWLAEDSANMYVQSVVYMP